MVPRTVRPGVEATERAGAVGASTSGTDGASTWRPLLAWTALFLAASGPSAGRVLDASPGWAGPLLLAWAVGHAAVLGGLTAALGLLPRGRRARAALVMLAGTGGVAWVAVDAALYALMGLHLHWTAWRVLGQRDALDTLGLGPVELAVAAGVLAVVALLGAAVSRRAPAGRSVALWLAVALAVDAAGSLGAAVARFGGSAASAALADAMPLAWAPRADALLTRLTGQPSRAPPQATFDLGAFERLRVPLSAWPAPTLARRPDVLLVVVESLRASDVDAMPHLEALARRAVVGGRHYASANCTLTASFSLYTGLSPLFATVDETWRSPAGLQAFAAAGYDVALARSASLDLGLAGRVLAGAEAHVVGSEARAAHARDDENVAYAQRWLSARGPKPRVLVLFLDSTHWPYAPEDGPDAAPPAGTWLAQLSADALHQRYRGALGRQDARLGALLDAVEGAGRWDDLVLVVTGDHGEAFGESGVLLHGSRLDEAQTRVPLVMHLPGVAARVLEAPSVHQDVLPTLLAHLGAQPPPPAGGGGADLLASGPRPVPPVLGFCGFGDPLGYALIEDGRKVLFGVAGGELVLKGRRTLDDVALPDEAADAPTRAALARVKAGFLSLLRGEARP
jgi:membrane-anchored protein YejM (alkaline phosphatase superfamily)